MNGLFIFFLIPEFLNFYNIYYIFTEFSLLLGIGPLTSGSGHDEKFNPIKKELYNFSESEDESEGEDKIEFKWALETQEMYASFINPFLDKELRYTPLKRSQNMQLIQKMIKTIIPLDTQKKIFKNAQGTFVFPPLLLMKYCGARVSEIVYLQRKNLMKIEGKKGSSYWVHYRQQKTQQEKLLEIPKKVYDFFESLKEISFLCKFRFPNTLRRAYRKVCSTNFNKPHAWRHTMCQRIRKKGITEGMSEAEIVNRIDAYLGHVIKKTSTDFYDVKSFFKDRLIQLGITDQGEMLKFLDEDRLKIILKRKKSTKKTVSQPIMDREILFMEEMTDLEDDVLTSGTFFEYKISEKTTIFVPIGPRLHDHLPEFIFIKATKTFNQVEPPAFRIERLSKKEYTFPMGPNDPYDSYLYATKESAKNKRCFKCDKATWSIATLICECCSMIVHVSCQPLGYKRIDPENGDSLNWVCDRCSMAERNAEPIIICGKFDIYPYQKPLEIPGSIKKCQKQQFRYPSADWAEPINLKKALKDRNLLFNDDLVYSMGCNLFLNRAEHDKSIEVLFFFCFFTIYSSINKQEISHVDRGILDHAKEKSRDGIYLPLELQYNDNYGWGVFALKAIRKNVLICEYVGNLYKTSDCIMTSGNDLFDIISAVNLDTGTTVWPTTHCNIARFINSPGEGESPNVYFFFL